MTEIVAGQFYQVKREGEMSGRAFLAHSVPNMGWFLVDISRTSRWMYRDYGRLKPCGVTVGYMLTGQGLKKVGWSWEGENTPRNRVYFGEDWEGYMGYGAEELSQCAVATEVRSLEKTDSEFKIRRYDGYTDAQGKRMR